jgi:hypothetical protein
LETPDVEFCASEACFADMAESLKLLLGGTLQDKKTFKRYREPAFSPKYLPCRVDHLREKAMALFESAYEKLEHGEYPESVALFRQGLDIDSDNAMALFCFAEAARALYGSNAEWPPGTFEEEADAGDANPVTKAQVLEIYEIAVAKHLDGENLRFAQERIRQLGGDASPKNR